MSDVASDFADHEHSIRGPNASEWEPTTARLRLTLPPIMRPRGRGVLRLGS